MTTIPRVVVIISTILPVAGVVLVIVRYQVLVGNVDEQGKLLVVEPTHLKNMLVKLDHFPMPNRDEHLKKHIWNHHQTESSPGKNGGKMVVSFATKIPSFKVNPSWAVMKLIEWYGFRPLCLKRSELPQILATDADIFLFFGRENVFSRWFSDVVLNLRHKELRAPNHAWSKSASIVQVLGLACHFSTHFTGAPGSKVSLLASVSFDEAAYSISEDAVPHHVSQFS